MAEETSLYSPFLCSHRDQGVRVSVVNQRSLSAYYKMSLGLDSVDLHVSFPLCQTVLHFIFPFQALVLLCYIAYLL